MTKQEYETDILPLKVFAESMICETEEEATQREFILRKISELEKEINE